MSTPVRLTGFVVGLLVVLVAAFGVGRAVGPVDTEPASSHGHGTDGGGRAHGTPAGLASSADGYTLRLASDTHPRDVAATFAFTIIGPDGAPLTTYTTTHEKDLHLIVVRRDGAGYQHLHPALEDDGTWSVGLRLPDAGTYKVFTDLVPAGGDPLTLAADLSVSGRFDPQPWPAAGSATTVDGYEVALDGEPVPGEHSRLTLTVRRDGRPVDDLEPYLGAFGHLVALRAGDLAFLHVHPEGEPGDGVTPSGPTMAFDAGFPTAGAYRLYLDFRHGGVVRTAELVLHVGDLAAAPGGSDHGAHDHDGHDHEH